MINDETKRKLRELNLGEVITALELPQAEVNAIHDLKRGIDRNSIQELSTCQFIHGNTDVIFQGFTGSGKTYLACAIGKQACKQQIRTRYIRLPDLLVEYDEVSLTIHSNLKLLKKYSSYGLLIIDEWLLDDISEDEQHFLFELIERRHDSV